MTEPVDCTLSGMGSGETRTVTVLVAPLLGRNIVSNVTVTPDIPDRYCTVTLWHGGGSEYTRVSKKLWKVVDERQELTPEIVDTMLWRGSGIA